MNGDIVKPPKPTPDQPPVPPAQPPVVSSEVQSSPSPVSQPPVSPKHPRWGRRILICVVAAVLLAAVVSAAGWLWYKGQLQAVAPGSDEKVKITVEPGTDTKGIAALLKGNDLIRSTQAFLWYVRINGQAGSLQSGTYRLAKADDVPTIVDHLTSGKTDTFSITFLPGNTLEKHRQVLIDAGYEASVVDAALNKDYQGALFSGKPARADLEGYIYGETYNFPADATPEQILQRTFDQHQSVIEKHGLVAKLKQKGFTLYEGITLASIIQREVVTSDDMAQVSQVFQLRLKRDMPLGSDVTYQYAADKLGVPRDVNLDSPYNTRRFGGLPPGPIASPGEAALRSVAEPAKGDYLYFLSGDDDKTYFARTNEEHERNIVEHCQKKCQII